jgi:hypothetical protein
LLRIWRFAALIASLTVVILFQNCSRVSFGNISPSEVVNKFSEDLRLNGGEVYDGKIIALHHYEEGFQCEGRLQPESVLIRAKDMSWTFIQNSPSRCAEVSQSPVDGVSYDPVANQAIFQGKNYIPPRPFLVDASEDPNLSDVKLLDGICENVNGKCSLMAAIETAVFVESYASAKVNVPPGLYKMSKVMMLNPTSSDSDLTVSGTQSSGVIIDGQNQTNIFSIGGRSKTLNIQKLTIQNGYTQAAGAGVSIRNFQGTLNFEDCLFSGNKNDASIYGLGVESLVIRKSRFINNLARFGNLDIFSAQKILVEDSTFTGNAAMALLLTAVSNVIIRNTTIANNAGTGINATDCLSCVFENLSIYQNQDAGINFMAQFPGAENDLTIRNSTIVKNGTMSLSINFKSNLNKVTMSNSIVSTANVSIPNCPPGGGAFFHDIVATNSIFDDSTCQFSGAGNRIGDPMLGPLTDNGGPTWTHVPLRIKGEL